MDINEKTDWVRCGALGEQELKSSSSHNLWSSPLSMAGTGANGRQLTGGYRAGKTVQLARLLNTESVRLLDLYVSSLYTCD